MRTDLICRSAILVAGSLLGTVSASATDWLQFGFDQAHSGNNPAETILSASATGEFALTALVPVYSVTLPNISVSVTQPDVADGAPAYLSGVTTAGGSRDLLFLETKHGHVLAIDAATGATVWSHATDPSPPPIGQDYTTSSPAIDPNRQYVYFYGLDGHAHKYAVGTGAETLTGGWPELTTLKPDVEKGSSALAIATAKNGTTYLYVTNGGYPGDAGDYQGHVTAINLATGAQNVFDSLCSGLTSHFVENGVTSGGGQNDCSEKQSAIWGRAGAVYDPSMDRIFVTTGNGTFNPANLYWGDTVLALNPQGTGSTGGNPVDSYTPSTFANLNVNDADLGSNSLALVPAPAGSSYVHLGVIAGKDGCVRLIRLDNMSGQGGPGHTGGSLQSQPLDASVTAANCDDTSTSGGLDAGGGEIRSQPAVWVNPSDASIWVFITNISGTLAGYKVVVTAGLPTLVQQWTSGPGTSPIVANGVLYYFSGSINALNPTTGAVLWSDSSPGGVHWESPIVVNGRIYVTDEGGKLWAYALDGIFKNGFE